MGTSRVRPVFEHGVASVSGQVIAASATYTKVIALSRADFTHGFVLLGNPFSITSSTQRRLTSSVYLTTASADAVAQSTSKDTTAFLAYGGMAYTIVNWAHKAYFQSTDSRLSDSIFQTQAINDTVGTGVRLTRAQIVGAQIELAFTNTYPSGPRTLTVDIEYRVEKVKNV